MLRGPTLITIGLPTIPRYDRTRRSRPDLAEWGLHAFTSCVTMAYSLSMYSIVPTALWGAGVWRGRYMRAGVRGRWMGHRVCAQAGREDEGAILSCADARPQVGRASCDNRV